MENWDQYQAAYQSADQATKSILHSSLIPECVADAVRKYELDDSHRRVLIALFSAELLKLHTAEECVEQLRAAAIPAAKVIHSEISTCLTTKKPSITDTSLVEVVPEEVTSAPAIPTTTSTPIKITAEPPQNLSLTPAAFDTVGSNDALAKEIAEAEAAFHQLRPIRTMAHDMDTLKQVDQPDHQATSQEDLLKGKAANAANPNARWNSGQ